MRSNPKTTTRSQPMTVEFLPPPLTPGVAKAMAQGIKPEVITTADTEKLKRNLALLQDPGEGWKKLATRRGDPYFCSVCGRREQGMFFVSYDVSDYLNGKFNEFWIHTCNFPKENPCLLAVEARMHREASIIDEQYRSEQKAETAKRREQRAAYALVEKYGGLAEVKKILKRATSST